MAVSAVRFVGVTAESGTKLLLTVVLVAGVLLLRWTLARVLRMLLRGERLESARFWSRQVLNLAAALVLGLGGLSIWFDDPGRLATALGLVTAGLAFALQRVVTALAGYLVILRGDMFSVGDRITMGGVRGDVVRLGFTKTTVMEVGQPIDGGDGGSWVRSRQYTGRLVTVSNAVIFDQPVFNDTRDFPFLWEEIAVPVPYDADRRRAEQVLLEAARRHTDQASRLGGQQLRALRQRYFVRDADAEPRVYLRLTDSWVELTVRFLTSARQVRDVKDAISREILDGMEAAGIPVASTTVQLVGLPPVRLRAEAAGDRRPPAA